MSIEDENRKKALLEQEQQGNITPSTTNENINKSEETKQVSGLGYVKTVEMKDAEEQEILRKEGSQIGFRDIKIQIVPTKGITLPVNVRMSARALTLEEIKHYSSMDEEEVIDIEEKIGEVFERCIRVYFGDKLMSWKDLPETDRIFNLFFLRDLTMQQHARDIKLYHTAKAPDGTVKRVEITNDIFAYNKIPSGIMKFYDAQERCFIVRDNGAEVFRFTIPTVGVIMGIKKYIAEKLDKRSRGEADSNYNRTLIDKHAEWLIMDWREINEQGMKMLHQRYATLSPEILDILDYLHKEFRYFVKPTVELEYGDGKTFESVIVFPRGISNIFNLSDIVDRLFKD